MSNINTPLYKALKSYIDKDFSRLHMPGHKGMGLYPFGEALAFDVTEVRGTDSLYDASEAILETEQRFAKLYGSTASFLSAGGSTLCIQTMLTLIGKPKGKIIAGRNIHLSAVNAMALLDLEPVWVYPEGFSGADLTGRITPQSIENALKQTTEGVCGVFITSPDYHGVISDVAGISAVCRRYDVPLVVDNAHGSALKFLENSLHPMDMGADMCCDSLHKTLPVLTGGAILHIKNEKYISKAKSAMAMFASTSPSYLIMLSCDMVLSYLENAISTDIKTLTLIADNLREKALAKSLTTVEGVQDETRLTLGFLSAGYNREEMLTLLDKHKIEPEYISQSHLVLLPSAFSRAEDFDRIENLIADIEPKKPIEIHNNYEKPERRMTIREAVFATHECIDIKNAEGRVAGEIKILCPPGIPIVITGEIITKQIIKNLETCGIFTMNVVYSR